MPSAGTVWVVHSKTLQCPWPHLVWATSHMLTCALAKGKITSQEYTPFLKWLLLLVSNFRLLHWWRLQDGLTAAPAHLCTPTVVHFLLSNVVKCVQKVCVILSSLFPHKTQFNRINFSGLSICRAPKGQVIGYSLLYLSPIETAEFRDRAHSTRLTSLCLAMTFLSWFP